MQVLTGCEPWDRHELGWESETQAWRLLYAGSELIEELQGKVSRFQVELIARRIWDEWPRDQFSPWQVRVEGEDFPVEVSRAKVRLPGCSAWVEWTWLGDDEDVVIRGLLAATDADVKKLLAGRPILQEVRRRVGRSPGWRSMSAAQFESKLREAVRELRRDASSFTQNAVANRVGVSLTAFKRYLDDAAITWQQIQSSEWPTS